MITTASLQALLGPKPELRGQVRYTGDLARRAYRLNRLITSLTDPATRQRFRDDPDACMADFGLTAEEARLMATRDCLGLFQYGVNIYAVAKAGTVLGVSLPEIGAQMRAMTPDEPPGPAAGADT